MKSSILFFTLFLFSMFVEVSLYTSPHLFYINKTILPTSHMLKHFSPLPPLSQALPLPRGNHDAYQ